MIDTWLRDVEPLLVRDEASVSVARDAVRAAGARLGMPETATAALVTAASELAHNQLAHARDGHFTVRPVARDGVPGLEIVAADRGEGITNPTEALRGRDAMSEPKAERGAGVLVSTPAMSEPRTGGLGIGLASVRDLCDELDVDVRLGEGTCVWARKFARPVRRRREVGIFGRPHPLERVNGDHAAFVRLDGALLLALSDGLGHGPAARQASRSAILRFMQTAGRPIDAVLGECDEAVNATRGAVMGVARVSDDGTLETSAVGNIVTYACGPSTSHRFSGSSAVLGMRGPKKTPRVETLPISTRDVVLLYSDGITHRATFDGRLDLLREHPITIAQRAVEEFARPDDDVLVLVAR